MAKRSTGKMKGDLVHIHAYISKELYEQLMACAQDTDIKGWQSQIIRAALREYVLGHKPRGAVQRSRSTPVGS